MSYEVRCECGKAHAVSAADAGSSLKCACGRAVDVPPLHQLRAAAGEVSLSPAFRLEALLLEGKLPGIRECVVCFRETDDLVHVQVDCERGRMTSDGSSRDGIAAGCLYGLLVGVFVSGRAGLSGANRLMQEGESGAPKQVGQDVAFTLPLPACAACRVELNDPTAVRAALRSVPEYAALLDQYPNALVARVE